MIHCHNILLVPPSSAVLTTTDDGGGGVGTVGGVPSEPRQLQVTLSGTPGDDTVTISWILPLIT